MNSIRKRVYVAGAYSADNVLGVLGNIRNGLRLATEVFLVGYAPFCPWLDHQFHFMLRDGEDLTVQHYYDYSITWLDVSDAVLLVPGWEQSRGTQNEIKRADDLNIPVFRDLTALRAYFEN